MKKIRRKAPSTDLALMDELLPPRASKSQRRRIQILEAAIEICASEGLEETTYDRIAVYCETSRQLVQHYFPKREEMFSLAIRYLRENSKKVVFEHLTEKQAARKTPDAAANLSDYIAGTFRWFDHYPTHAKVWPVFYSYAASNKKYRDMNTEISAAMAGRILALVAEGNKLGQFNCPDPEGTARAIQMLLTGALLTLLTENLDVKASDVERQVQAIALQIACAR